MLGLGLALVELPLAFFSWTSLLFRRCELIGVDRESLSGNISIPQVALLDTLQSPYQQSNSTGSVYQVYRLNLTIIAPTTQTVNSM